MELGGALFDEDRQLTSRVYTGNVKPKKQCMLVFLVDASTQQIIPIRKRKQKASLNSVGVGYVDWVDTHADTGCLGEVLREKSAGGKHKGNRRSCFRPSGSKSLTARRPPR